jgi:hypothetical protein
MKKIIDQLKKLKKLGVVAVKQSLEDEGAGFSDIALMRKITIKTGLKLNIKIGGCEAKNDIFFCNSIKVDGIVAPMVESEYALKKFVQTIPKSFNGNLFINLESKNAFINLKKILSSNEFNKLKGVVIGRSDLAGSYNLSKSMVNSKKIYNVLNANLKKIKLKKKLVKMGGSITKDSSIFIRNLFKKKLIDRIETRNIEVKLNNKVINNLEYIISLIFKFEVYWLKFKNLNFKLDKIIQKSNLKRVKEIESR